MLNYKRTILFTFDRIILEFFYGYVLEILVFLHLTGVLGSLALAQ
jgi:hypothetical protein